MYDATWTSVRTHTVPDWYHDAKLGVFLHWGLYSVPAWAPLAPDISETLAKRGPVGMFRNNPYAEWYQNSAELRGTQTWRRHRAVYGRDHRYADFRTPFDAASIDADMDGLAATLRGAGAEYVVLTTKHHDGFTLWPSDVPHPTYDGWSARRDIVGDLTEAVRRADMRMGFYYSGGYDWSYNGARMRRASDSLLATPVGPEYAEYAERHVRELIERYRPSILWNDIGWPGAGDLARLFADFYNAVPEGVVNDRWVASPAERSRAKRVGIRILGELLHVLWRAIPSSVKEMHFAGALHADFATPEYATFDEIRESKWEQTRGVGHSFALNRNESVEHMIAIADLVRNLVDVVSKNGNLLLGIGPEADGSIPPAQREVLSGLGAWMAVNRPAVHGSRPWVRAEGRTLEGTPTRFTRSPDALNVFLMETPRASRQTLDVRAASPDLRVDLLGGGELHTALVDGRVVVDLPAALPDSPVHTLRLRGSEISDRA